MNTNTKKLSLLSFFAITASMVMTVYEYPTFATSKMKDGRKGDYTLGSQIHWEESGALRLFSFNGFKLQLALSR